MNKLSAAYRQDEPDDLPFEIRDYLDEHFLKHLANFDKSNPKVLVVYAGGNAVGKSALSNRIGQELGGLVLENDAIKRCLLEYNPSITKDELNVLTWKYSIDVYKRLGRITSNGLVVRDGVIHWYYDRILPIFEKQGYKIFIISYELSEAKQIELIRRRGDTPTTTAERLVTIMEDHAIHLARFKEAYEPDVILNDNTVFDHDQVIDKLREYIRNLSGDSLSRNNYP